MTDDTGAAVTVEGRIDPDDLGTVLPHEHVFASWDSFEMPEKPHERKLAREDLSMDVLGYLRRNPEAIRDNLRLESSERAVEELANYRRAGGTTVVDLSFKPGLDPVRVRQVARATGLQFVHGTAYYVADSHPDRIAGMDVEEIAAEFVADVREGIADTDVRAGIIGEIGLSGTIHDEEERVLRAAARAALRTGAPLNIHPPLFGPDPAPEAALDALDVVEEEGLALERVVVSHMDQDHLAMQDLADHVAIAERGAYVEFDQWGGWDMYMERREHAYPSDATRVDAVLELVDRGYGSRLLFSHDVCTKRQLTAFGGFGYAHVPENVVPWLRRRGLSDHDVDLVLRENPERVLTFDAPAG